MFAKSSCFYFKFLEYAEDMGIAELVRIDASEEKLLIQLGQRWNQGERMTVSVGMSLMPGVSIGTTHRRLKSLRSKGLLTLIPDKTDHRIKYIAPTTLARNYFEILDKCLKLAFTSKNQAFKKVLDPNRSLEVCLSVM